jgi:hypothetical protein
MRSLIAPLVPLAFILVPGCLIVALVKFWEWQSKNYDRKNPLTSDLLRGPGEAIREKLLELRLDIFGDLLLLFLLPILTFSISLSMEAFGRNSNLLTHILNIIITVGVVIFLLWRIFRHKKSVLKYNLGLDAEIAVGQELNHLMREGYWVYHDFPAKDFNIDHVLIGPTGVFAIETKGRGKPIKANGSTERELIYDGDTLRFPHKTEQRPLIQAESQAKWLENWLTSAVGEPVPVTPVLAIPGWFIKQTKRKGIPVINGKNPSAFFASWNKDVLSEKLQRQIVHQIDTRCRTVLPRAYQPIK